MKHRATVHYLSVVGPAVVCAVTGALLGWGFGNPVTGAVAGLAAGAAVTVFYLILISIGRVPAESATPELSQPDAEPRNHVICIDGTWNHPEVPTNVRKFFDYVDVDADGKQQIARYYSGVGARENKGVALRVLKKNYSGLLFGGATGYGTEAILRQAYFDFVQEYRRGDRLFIVGFSRGAATARLLANMISSTHGLPASVEIQHLKLFIEKDVVVDLDIKVPCKWGVPEAEFLGVWDTVAAFGNPWNRVDLFKDLTLAPGIQKAYHLVAIDERRRTFDVTLLDPDERVEQIWFAGAHANVGGGLEEENSGLSDIALRFMINRAREHGLRFKKEAFDLRGDAGGTMWQAGRFWWWKIERRLGGDTRQLPRIHKSVFQRMESVSNYEPANVKELGNVFQRDERD